MKKLRKLTELKKAMLFVGVKLWRLQEEGRVSGMKFCPTDKSLEYMEELELEGYHPPRDLEARVVASFIEHDGIYIDPSCFLPETIH